MSLHHDYPQRRGVGEWVRYGIDRDGRTLLAAHDEDGAHNRQIQASQLGALLESSPDAVVMVNADGLVVEWNPAAECLLKAPRLAVLGAPVQSVLFASQSEQFGAAWYRLLAGNPTQRFEFHYGQTAGGGLSLGVIVAPVRLGGAFTGAVLTLRDLDASSTADFSRDQVGARNLISDALSDLPDTQPVRLAGLPGRQWLNRQLSDPPATGFERGLAMFDIGVFAMINGTYGPDAADDILHRFAKFLQTLDTPGTFVHWRADVFFWLVDSVDPMGDLNQFVKMLERELEVPFSVLNDDIWLSLNIGLATPTLAEGSDLLFAARDALHSARAAEDSSIVYYDKTIENTASMGLKSANDLRHAITHDELRLHYQPIMELASNEIAGVEALVRWQRPNVGLLPPDAFINTAERTGQIVPLGNWVARNACKAGSGLGEYSRGPRTMSINVSPRQLRDDEFVATLQTAMSDGDCAPATTIVEVTETVLLSNLNTVGPNLEAIKALGVGIDLDDFGTGYSSLQYLRALPIDRLKVERSFVAGLGVSTSDTAIVAYTIALAHALGFQTVAEGVETEEQLALLQEMECDFVQGYLISRPLELDALTVWLEAYVPGEIPPTAAEEAVAALRKRGHVEPASPGSD